MMRKFTLLFGGCLLMSSTMFAAKEQVEPFPKLRPAIHQKAPNAARLPGAPETRLKFTQRFIDAPAVKKAPAGVEIPEIITEAPAGEVKYYSKESAGYYPFWGYILDYEESGLAASVVEGDDGYLYFLDIISTAGAGTYVKASVEGDKVSVGLPQCIMFYESYGYGLNLVALDPIYEEEDGEQYLVDLQPSESTSATFTIGDDGSITLDEGTILGLAYTDDGTWSGYADLMMSFTPFNETPVEMPEGAATERWAISYTGGVHFVDVATEGSDLYIRGACYSAPDFVIKGTITGDKVTFADSQYLGTYSSYFSYLKFATGKKGFENGEPTIIYTLTGESAEYNYDAAAKTLTPVDNSLYMLFNGSADRVYYIEALTMPSFDYRELKPATPAAPEFIGYTDKYATGGYSELTFNLPACDTEGNPIDIKNYYYRVYLDDEVFVFYPDEYMAFTNEEGETDIPYRFSDGYDIIASREEHLVSFYLEGFDSLGVKGFYTAGGVTRESDMMVYDAPAAIEGVAADGSAGKVLSETYYDLTGRETSKPTSGIIIKRTVYNDGTVKSEKNFIR